LTDIAQPRAAGQAAPASASDAGPDVAKLSLLTMAAMVVGSMVGAGVFSLPRRFGQETGVAGALIAWLVAGAGMLMLAFVFRTLAIRKPTLDAGVYAYAKAGFGEYLGFFSAFGYWASACVGNVFYWILIMSTLGALFPGLGNGETVLAIVLSSGAVWLYFLLIRRGVREAAVINRIVTIAKVLPIVVFIVLCLFALNTKVFTDNFVGSDYGSLFDQVTATMLVTVFTFLGIEGASTYSRHAKNRSDVGKATVLGFLGVLAIFASVTIVSYGILPASQIAQLRQPSMAGVLEAAVGPWGSIFVSAGLIVSVLGAYLAWTLMSAEVLFVAAQTKDMPRFLARSNEAGVPSAALIMTTILIQVILVATLFSEDAFNFALDLTAALSLIPYLFVAAYGLKLALTRETYLEQPAGRGRELVIGAVATAYTIFLLFAAGPRFILVSFIIYAPASILFVMARREQGRRLFSPVELVILAISVIGALVGVGALATGAITL
jgi:arginine:ornithine antiporter / lysine permease